MPVQFFFLKKNINLANRNALKKFIIKIFKEEKVALENLTYIFCSDDYLLSINKAHLKHNFFTDIITFNLSESSKPIHGEIYISTDRVRDNAQTHKTTLTEEFHRVIFHGALHLCGYKDKTSKDIKEMRAAENKLLSKFFI